MNEIITSDPAMCSLDCVQFEQLFISTTTTTIIIIISVSVLVLLCLYDVYNNVSSISITVESSFKLSTKTTILAQQHEK